MSYEEGTLERIFAMTKNEEFEKYFDYHYLCRNPFEKPYINILVANKNSSHQDDNIGISFLKMTEALELNLLAHENENKKDCPDADFVGENWSAHKPFVYDNTGLSETNIILGQVHFGERAHIYLVDNERVMKNLTIDALRPSNSVTFIKMNTYGKLINMPVLDDPTSLIEALQKESKEYDPFKGGHYKEKFMKENFVFTLLKKNYNEANRRIDYVVGTTIL